MPVLSYIFFLSIFFITYYFSWKNLVKFFKKEGSFFKKILVVTFWVMFTSTVSQFFSMLLMAYFDTNFYRNAMHDGLSLLDFILEGFLLGFMGVIMTVTLYWYYLIFLVIFNFFGLNFIFKKHKNTLKKAS